MNQKHVNIPIFLPELACPNRCVFCNQANISGTYTIPTIKDTISTIELHLKTIPSHTITQVAFFGGSFTGLPIEVQLEYLNAVQPYLKKGNIHGIRLSTRPDYISPEILDMLKLKGVEEIELGAQSFNDDVLIASGRGHTAQDIEKASRMVLDNGFRLGLQMMIGLPGDSFEKSIYTAQSIIRIGAHSTRIYPTLVIKDTPLELLYNSGRFAPLSLKEAVELSAHLYRMFEDNNVTILRVGLHQNEDFNSGKKLIAGPYHPSFKELVISEIWRQIFKNKLPKTRGKMQIWVAEEHINYAIGLHSKNKAELQSLYGWIQIKADKSLHNYEFRYCYN